MTSVPIPLLQLDMTGETFEFQTSAKSGDGKFRFQWTLQPGKKGPPPHVHDDENETFNVVSGTLRIWIEGKPNDVTAGQSLTVKRGELHRFLNPAKVPVVVNVMLDGTKMEDGLVPLALHVGDRKARLGDMWVAIVHGTHIGGSQPRSKLARALTRGVARFVRLFGVKPLPLHGAWQVRRDEAAASQRSSR
jgi:mannose-6-phosphate isomerase-like protein (cupin superfamily)